MRKLGQKTTFHTNFGMVDPERLKRLAKDSSDFEKFKKYSMDTDKGYP
jgi:hypothetical protein